MNDIRMTSLQIPTQLLGGSIEVPYVDRLKDGKTGFLYSVKGYIGGYKGSTLGATVPGKPVPITLTPTPASIHKKADHARN